VREIAGRAEKHERVGADGGGVGDFFGFFAQGTFDRF
jgi:hypothetical protein